MTPNRDRPLRNVVLETIEHHRAAFHCDDCQTDVLAALRIALGDSDGLDAAGTCWFCKGRFPVDALIAGYDTWDESRLACLACNERMSGNWRASGSQEDRQPEEAG